MEEQFNTGTTVDAKTAKEALELAIRLQHENGERVPLAELQRTADEAGIDRAYLESALKQVSSQQVLIEQPSIRPRQLSTMLAAMFASMFLALILTTSHGGNIPIVPFLIALFAAMFVVVRRKRRGCSNWRSRQL